MPSEREPDLFGDVPKGLDISDAGLADRWETASELDSADADLESVLDAADGVVSVEEPEHDEGHDGVDAEGDESTTGESEPGEGDEHQGDTDEGDEDPGDEVHHDSVDDVAAERAAALAAQKSADELAKMVVDAQIELGRRSGEVGQTRGQIEALQQQLAALQQMQAAQFAAMQQQAAAYGGPDIDTLIDHAERYPEQAYQQAINALDQGVIGIHDMEAVIREVATFNPDLGRMMERDFDRRMVIAQMRAQYEEQLAPVQTSHAQAVTQQATARLWAEDVDARNYKDEIIAYFKVNGNPTGSAEEQYGQLRRALALVRDENPTKSERYKQLLEQANAQKLSAAVEAEKVNARVEKGSSAKSKSPEKTEEEAYRERAFANNRNDYMRDLFG